MLHLPRKFALWIISTLVFLATVTSFTESYRALYVWASKHDLFGLWAGIWPIQIDVFIAVGELTLFVALVDQWKTRQRVFPWAVAMGGLAASVAANIGHVSGHTWTDRGTAAVPPLAAWAALTVGLGVLKRVRTLHPPTVAANEREEAVTSRPAPATMVQRPSPGAPNWGTGELIPQAAVSPAPSEPPVAAPALHQPIPQPQPTVIPQPNQPTVVPSNGPVRPVRLGGPVNGSPGYEGPTHPHMLIS